MGHCILVHPEKPLPTCIIIEHISGLCVDIYQSWRFKAVKIKINVTPQVVDKFAFYSINLSPRHPERSEGS
jgi:hypothetical protein